MSIQALSVMSMTELKSWIYLDEEAPLWQKDLEIGQNKQVYTLQITVLVIKNKYMLALVYVS